MRRLLLCLGFLTSIAPAVAQVRVCMGGNLDQLTAADRQGCEDQVSRVRDAAVRKNAPADWHFVVVCGEDGWKDYTAFSLAGESALRDSASDTDFENRTTFLRGTRLVTQDASDTIMLRAFRSPSADVQVARK